MSRPAAPVPPAVLRVARDQAGLVALRQCLDGGMTPRQVTRRQQRKEWERVARGVYDTGLVVPSSWHESYEIRRRRTAFLGPLVYPGAVLLGLGALVLHGVQGVPAAFRPEVAVAGAQARRGRGPVRVRRVEVRPVTVDGVPCATVGDALATAVPTLGRLDAVAVVDSARRLGLLPGPDLDRARAATTGRPGARLARECWAASDARAESPAESWARVRCRDRGFPPDAVQLWVVGRGFRARVDLAWVLPDGGLLLVEVDGRDVHERPEALFGDRARQNRIDTRETLVRRYTGREAGNGALAADVGKSLVALGWQPRPVGEDVAYDIDRHRFFPIRW